MLNTTKIKALVASIALMMAVSCTTMASRGPDTALSCPECPLLSVERIVDGDTFDSAAGRVRLFGADTPERGAPCFGEATERLEELAGDAARVEPGPRQVDSYGRQLLYAYTEDGESIDELLVREGLAVAWTEDGQHRDLLVAVEARAGQEGIGCLW